MTGRSHKRIYVCEKDAEIRVLLESAMPPDEVSISGFSEHQECLDRLAAKPCDLLILDLDGCGPRGLHLLEQARQMAPWVTSLVIVEHAAVPCAIKAIRAGADECLDKPVQQARLVAAVTSLLARFETSGQRRPKALTQMEARILQLILGGKTSHDIAAELHRSKRTIDVHRKNIMRKLQATSLVDFIKRALEMGFADHLEQTDDSPEWPGDEHGDRAE